MEHSENNLAGLEALLFIHGEPMTLAKIAEVLGIEKNDAGTLVHNYGESLRAESRGLTLVREGDRVQLATKPEWGHILERFVKSELSEDLTPASLETLAIIAYFGPLSRARIDYQRGVNSSFIVRNLLLRGLIDRAPDAARPNSFLYRPSFEFLKHLGVANKEALPEYEKFASLLKAFESQETPPGPLEVVPEVSGE